MAKFPVRVAYAVIEEGFTRDMSCQHCRYHPLDQKIPFTPDGYILPDEYWINYK